MQLKSLHDKTEPLMSKVDSLEEVIGELLKEKDNGTRLLLIGNNPPHDSNAYEAIRGVITDTLGLYDLSSSIKFAELVNGGIMFELKNAIEKHRILIRAQERFNTDKRKIVDFCFNEGSNSDIPDIFYRTGITEKSVEETKSDNDDRLVFEWGGSAIKLKKEKKKMFCYFISLQNSYTYSLTNNNYSFIETTST